MYTLKNIVKYLVISFVYKTRYKTHFGSYNSMNPNNSPMEKTTQLHIRLSESEKKRIEVKAKSEGKSVSEYLRQKALAK